jgi:phosphoribosylamine-glycine ligase
LLINGIEEANKIPNVKVYHAGASVLINHNNTENNNEQFVTSGGRVLNVTGTGSSLNSCVRNAYNGVSKFYFEGMHFRKDIAYRFFYMHYFFYWPIYFYFIFL